MQPFGKIANKLETKLLLMSEKKKVIIWRIITKDYLTKLRTQVLTGSWNRSYNRI